MKTESLHSLSAPPLLTTPTDVVRVILNSNEDCILSGKDVFETNIRSLSPSINMQWFCKNGDTIYKHQNIVSFNIETSTCLQKTFLSALQVLSHLSGLATLTYCYVSSLKNANSTKIQILTQRKEYSTWLSEEEMAIKHGKGEGTVHCVEDINILTNLDLLKEQKETVFTCRNSNTVEYLLENLPMKSDRLAFHNTMNWRNWIAKIPNNIQVGLWGNIQCNDITHLSHDRLSFIIPSELSYSPSVDFCLKCF